MRRLETGWFEIDSGTGEISYDADTGAGYNFETDDDITLTVVATSGADRAETQVTINLVDLAEPEFVLLPTDNTVTLAENVDGSGDTPVLLGRVMAIDPGT